VIELSPDQFQRADPLVRNAPINHLFARSVIERKVAGKVWVDRHADPSLAHILHPYGMSLLVGDAAEVPAGNLRTHILGTCTGVDDQWMQASPAALWPILDGLFGLEPRATEDPPGGLRVQRYGRANFRFDPSCYASKRLSVQVPEDCSFHPLTAGEYALADIAVSPHKFWSNAAQFLTHGGGWYLEKGGQLVSMAFCSFRFDDQFEIGIETRAEYRGQGYALHAACKLIDQCIAQGLEPVWSCRKENRGSYFLAQALGFQPTVVVPYYRLPGTG
jgi:hypothetical protein